MSTRYKCRICGKLTAGRLPRASWFRGDGSVYMPRRHAAPKDADPSDVVHSGRVGGLSQCAGIFHTAIEVYEDGREYDPDKD